MWRVIRGLFDFIFGLLDNPAARFKFTAVFLTQSNFQRIVSVLILTSAIVPLENPPLHNETAATILQCGKYS